MGELIKYIADETDGKAFDTLYIGCAKFPRQTTAPVIITGVS